MSKQVDTSDEEDAEEYEDEDLEMYENESYADDDDDIVMSLSMPSLVQTQILSRCAEKCLYYVSEARKLTASTRSTGSLEIL